MSLSQLIDAIGPIDARLIQRIQATLDTKTKPVGSLGVLETLASRIGAARGDASAAPLQKTVIVMAGDHGVTAAGVSAYPSEVTHQMVLNFAAGGAAINVLCRQVGAELIVADLGVAADADVDGVINLRVRPGTRDMRAQPAMTEQEVLRAIEAGAELCARTIERGTTLVGLGEMGIGNTTAATALLCTLTGHAPAGLVGPGTGLDADGIARKLAALEAALLRHELRTDEPLRALQCVGGLEIAGLVGVVLAAAGRRVPVVLDGFISSAAGLVAARLAPLVQDYLFASHLSAEPGHRVLLDALGLSPLLQLDLRLGEGSGAALSMPLFDAAQAILREMATFAAAGVSERH